MGVRCRRWTWWRIARILRWHRRHLHHLRDRWAPSEEWVSDPAPFCARRFRSPGSFGASNNPNKILIIYPDWPVSWATIRTANGSRVFLVRTKTERPSDASPRVSKVSRASRAYRIQNEPRLELRNVRYSTATSNQQSTISRIKRAGTRRTWKNQKRRWKELSLSRVSCQEIPMARQLAGKDTGIGERDEITSHVLPVDSDTRLLTWIRFLQRLISELDKVLQVPSTWNNFKEFEFKYFLSTSK